MDTVTSADGTAIAFDEYGSGPPIIVAMGAFGARGAGEPLARRLCATHRVLTYDRRGRGDSSDTDAYRPDREVEDLAALIEVVGGRASVVGHSSGAVLALRAAAAGLPIDFLALYEPPTPQPGRGPQFWLDLAETVDGAVRAGDRGGAVETFQRRGVGMPATVVDRLRGTPSRPALERLAHTLPYDARVLAVDPWLPASVTTPALVMAGALSPDPLQDAARSVAGMLPAGSLRVLAGVGHSLDPEAVGSVVEDAMDRPATW